MKAMKCDRCGVYYQEEKYKISYKQNGKVLNNYDLCGSCAALFDDFIKGIEHNVEIEEDPTLVDGFGKTILKDFMKKDEM